MGSWRSTISEKIRVGFTTTNPRGFLLGFFSTISGEYMTIAVSNSGHLRIVLDFGFERQELIYQGHNFGMGQYHDVRITRRDSGSKLIMQVSNNLILKGHLLFHDLNLRSTTTSLRSSLSTSKHLPMPSSTTFSTCTSAKTSL
jgi:Laminin G domain